MPNLNEAYGTLNTIKGLIGEVDRILSNRDVIVKTTKTHLRSEVDPDAKDETVVVTTYGDAYRIYADHVTDLVHFYGFLIKEKEKLVAAIRTAKMGLEFDFEGERLLNADRQKFKATLRRMVTMEGTSTIREDEGRGYKFNAENVQTVYRCNLREESSINFNRKYVQKVLGEMNKKTLEVSRMIEQTTANTLVDYEAPFSFDDGLKQSFDEYLRSKGEKGLYTSDTDGGNS